MFIDLISMLHYKSFTIFLLFQGDMLIDVLVHAIILLFQGDMLIDVLVHAIIPCCALIQENKQLFGLHGSHIGEKIPLNQEIERR